MNNRSMRKARTGMPLAATCAVAIGLLAGSWPGLAISGGPQQKVASAASIARTASAAVYDDGRAMTGAHSRAALTAQWWRWLYSIPIAVSPGGDTSGVNCDINQQGDVWFLAGPISGFDVTCTVPVDKAIVSAVYAFLDDYPCPPGVYLDGSTGPGPGQRLEDFLLKDAAPYIDGAMAAAQLDGRLLKVRRIMSGLFGFTAAVSVSAGDVCVTGSPQLGVSDGYFVFIEPLSRGDHLLQLSWTSPGGSSATGTVHLKIR
jgi:hypothetical protein